MVLAPFHLRVRVPGKNRISWYCPYCIEVVRKIIWQQYPAHHRCSLCGSYCYYFCLSPLCALLSVTQWLIIKCLCNLIILKTTSSTPTSQICFFRSNNIHNLGAKQCDNSYFSSCHSVYQFLEVLPAGNTRHYHSVKVMLQVMLPNRTSRVLVTLLPAQPTEGPAKS